MVLVGIWFLASASTENGLLPSGHGAGRVSEIIIGVGTIGYSIFRLTRKSPRPITYRRN